MADRQQVEEWKQNPWSRLPTWGKWVVGAFGVFIVIGIIGAIAEDESEDGQPEPVAAESRPGPAREPAEPAKSTPPLPAPTPKPEPVEKPVPKPEPEPVVREPSPQQLVREALGESVSADLAIGESEVRSVSRTGQLMNVILSTPEGGFEGPSSSDADALASAAMAKVYEDADWQGAVWVEFRGGLVNSETGRDLPNAESFTYRIERGQAKRIDWSDEEALYSIDWSLYRGFCHPAFKGC